MIADILENAHLYACLGERYEKAFRFLAETDFSGLGVGEYDIDGKDLFFRIQMYETMPPEQCKIELHQLHVDIHYIVEGTEQFGYVHKSRCAPKVPYDPKIDMALVSCDDMGYVVQRPGCFAVAFPDDAHQSCRVHGRPEMVKKALVKVRGAIC